MGACKFEGCLVKNAVFNFPTETKGIYCSKHKLKEQVDVKNAHCLEKDCLIQPTYNFPNKTRGIYCSKHKLEGCMDIKHKRCVEVGCLIQPTYNKLGEKKGIYCLKHKLKEHVDVRHSSCLQKNCLIRPSYNFPNKKKAIYCSEHKLEGHTDIYNKKCIHSGCIKLPNYNIPSEKIAVLCNDHRLPNMVDVKNKLCSNCNLYRPQKRIVEKIKINLCEKCFCKKYPTEKQPNKISMKEYHIAKDLKKIYGNNYFACNKQFPNTKIKPDLLREFVDYILVIEIDEHQHRDYKKGSDDDRLNRLHEVVKKPIVVIRFNCDRFRVDKQIVEGCFKFDDDKLVVNETEYEIRFNRLVKKINKHIDNIPTKDITVKFLYYDKKIVEIHDVSPTGILNRVYSV
jgi:hypothetical protein